MRRLLSDPIFEAAANPPMRTCDHPGCIGVGDFRAPKSRLDLHDYHWFCLEHVRAYNSAWNYYAEMSDVEIEAEIRHDTVWQRPSWRLGDPKTASFLRAGRTNEVRLQAITAMLRRLGGYPFCSFHRLLCFGRLFFYT
jgi:hypothetical protein